MTHGLLLKFPSKFHMPHSMQMPPPLKRVPFFSVHTCGKLESRAPTCSKKRPISLQKKKKKNAAPGNRDYGSGKKWRLVWRWWEVGGEIENELLDRNGSALRGRKKKRKIQPGFNNDEKLKSFCRKNWQIFFFESNSFS